MLKNYFKIAIAVLRRRKFFTFISLFGISFTLAILIVLTAFYDHLVSPAYPDHQRSRSLYLNSIELNHRKKQSHNQGPPSLYFMNKFVATLKTPEKVAISSIFGPTNTYVNNRKLVINVKYTNTAYWEVQEYDFLEGKPYSMQDLDAGSRVAVISRETKENYFGDAPTVVGRYINTNNEQFRVIGVVDNVPKTMLYSYADMYLPYTLSKTEMANKSYNSNFTAILLARSEKDLPAIQSEFAAMIQKVPLDSAQYDEIKGSVDSYVASFTRIFNGGGSSAAAVRRLIVYVSIFVFLFMLLPTINLVNINTSRIMERSSEIGVRKAFGASSGTLAIQFIVENLILTFLGGIIGVLLSWAVLSIVNGSRLIPNAHLGINFTVLGASVLACIVFGLLSGVFPAWRMSRMQVVTALKAN
ncbi:ABC transporter permease [Chitinophaga lutea]|uniref:ABC transporter permease n=1 Tax=Chitinophaga lutea TaxID=2488634 RepID=A0A3N4PBD9_9BACT|nr:ABC transporter permease [Chitinophaga lutea]RPE05992.1 ABC transporter permease [Chitinophaga lutea]